MNIISRRAHGVLDYLVGVILIIAPKLLGFDNTGAASQVPVILGFATLAYSLITNYELGLLKVLPFKTHLTLDVLSGVLLALSPWLFQFSDRVWIPHVVLGVVEIGAVLMTRTTASAGPRGTGAHP